eukprot:5190658-Karenia_brevis.AAC.1
MRATVKIGNPDDGDLRADDLNLARLIGVSRWNRCNSATIKEVMHSEADLIEEDLDILHKLLHHLLHGHQHELEKDMIHVTKAMVDIPMDVARVMAYQITNNGIISQVDLIRLIEICLQFMPGGITNEITWEQITKVM